MKKLLFFLCTLMPAIALADSDVSAEKASQNTPDGWTAVNLPSIAAITSANHPHYHRRKHLQHYSLWSLNIG